jgi:DNA-binding NarL/FixJ family response regulator
MIRVLLADDHPVVRSGYLRLLEQTGDIAVSAQAADADTAYAAFVADPPAVLVSDLSMPGGGGLELLRHVLLRDSQARVLVFSMHDSAVLVRRALEAGARGFLSKASAPECLVDAIRAVHAGRRYLGPDLPADLQRSGPDDEARRLGELSAREFEIFRLLAQGHSAADCARLLKLSPKTVANQQTVIKEKLAVSTSAALVHLAIRQQVISSAGA